MSRSAFFLLVLCLIVGTPGGEAATAAAPTGSVVAVDRPGAGDLGLSAERRRWTAPQGPFFNDPRRKKGYLPHRAEGHRDYPPHQAGVDDPHRGLLVERMPVAEALVAAHKRGVKVQMLLNDHQYTKAMRVVRQRIGAKRSADSFIYRCTAGCRATANRFNNMHSKFYLFSRAWGVTRRGGRRFGEPHAQRGDPPVERPLLHLRRPCAPPPARGPLRRHGRRPRHAPSGSLLLRHAYGAPCATRPWTSTRSWAYPRPSGPRNDLVLDTLAKVQCLTPTASGGQTRTRLALSMHTMRGRRGDYLAAAIRDKFAEGCKVRVSYGLIGFHTKKVIGKPTRRGRIPLRSTGLDYNPDDNYDLNKDGNDDLILNFYSHQKYLTIQGTFDGVPELAPGGHRVGELGEPQPGK